MCSQVRDYLFAQSDLNLTRSDEATPASNVIYLMELQPPPKAPALAFLDSGGAVPAPPRQVCFLFIHCSVYMVLLETVPYCGRLRPDRNVTARLCMGNHRYPFAPRKKARFYAVHYA